MSSVLIHRGVRAKYDNIYDSLVKIDIEMIRLNRDSRRLSIGLEKILRNFTESLIKS